MEDNSEDLGLFGFHIIAFKQTFSLASLMLS